MAIHNVMETTDMTIVIRIGILQHRQGLLKLNARKNVQLILVPPIAVGSGDRAASADARAKKTALWA